MPGSVLCRVDQMVALVDAKESGHLFLVAKGGEEGYATCTFDDAPFGRKSVFNVVTQYAGIDI